MCVCVCCVHACVCASVDGWVVWVRVYVCGRGNGEWESWEGIRFPYTCTQNLDTLKLCVVHSKTEKTATNTNLQETDLSKRASDELAAGEEQLRHLHWQLCLCTQYTSLVYAVLSY